VNAYESDISPTLGANLVLLFLANCIHHSSNSNFRDQLRHALTYAYPSQLYSSRLILDPPNLKGEFGSATQWLHIMEPHLQLRRKKIIGCELHRRQEIPLPTYLEITATGATLQIGFERYCTKQLRTREAPCGFDGCNRRGTNTVSDIVWPSALAVRCNVSQEQLQTAQTLTVPASCHSSLREHVYELRAVVRQQPGHFVTFTKTTNSNWLLDDDGYSFTNKLFEGFPHNILPSIQYHVEFLVYASKNT